MAAVRTKPGQDIVPDSPGRPRPIRMLVVTALWGSCFVAIRLGLPAITPLWFATLRSAIAGALLLTIVLLLRRAGLPRRVWPAVILLGLVNVTLAFGAMFLGTVQASVGVAATLANAQPILIILPAWLLFRERPRPVQFLGVTLGFAGVVITATPLSVGSGALLSLGSAAAITAGTLLARRLAAQDPLALTAWQFVAGSLGLAAWAFFTEGVPRVSWTPAVVTSLMFLALLGTAAAYLLWFAELRRSQMIALSGWTMLAPVFGILAGWLTLNDALSIHQGLGIVLVLLSMPLINGIGLWRGRRPARKTK